MKDKIFLKRINRYLGESENEGSNKGITIEGDYHFTGKPDEPIAVVTGDLTVDEDVTSLEGCPERVEGIFDCSGCKNLKSLKGAPKEVGQFICRNCDSLVDLVGCQTVTENYDDTDYHVIDCSGCKNLKSLKGAEKSGALTFKCSNCDSLTSLKYCPADDCYEGAIDCSGCKNLISLGKSFNLGALYCNDCIKLKDLGRRTSISFSADFAGCESLDDYEIEYIKGDCESVTYPNGDTY